MPVYWAISSRFCVSYADRSRARTRVTNSCRRWVGRRERVLVRIQLQESSNLWVFAPLPLFRFSLPLLTFIASLFRSSLACAPRQQQDWDLLSTSHNLWIASTIDARKSGSKQSIDTRNSATATPRDVTRSLVSHHLIQSMSSRLALLFSVNCIYKRVCIVHDCFVRSDRSDVTPYHSVDTWHVTLYNNISFSKPVHVCENFCISFIKEVCIPNFPVLLTVIFSPQVNSNVIVLHTFCCFSVYAMWWCDVRNTNRYQPNIFYSVLYLCGLDQ